MERLNKAIYILILYSLLPSCLYLQAQETPTDKPTKYVELLEEEQNVMLFNGFSLYVDIFSPIQKMLSDYGGIEAGLNLNLKNTFYPTVEIGYGICNHEDGNTLITYKTSAPYFKIGLDYNILKDKNQTNKLFVGCRYGFSFFNFDISGPEIIDPIWKNSEPFNYKNINTTSHWFEILAGVRVKIWRNIHLGWSVRYKKHLSSSSNDYAEPYYIPGYGTTTNSSSWGGTYSIIFDLNWGKKKHHKSQDL